MRKHELIPKFTLELALTLTSSDLFSIFYYLKVRSMRWIQNQMAEIIKENTLADLPLSEKLRRRKANWDTKDRVERKDKKRSELSDMVLKDETFIIVDGDEVEWFSHGDHNYSSHDFSYCPVNRQNFLLLLSYAFLTYANYTDKIELCICFHR